MKSIEITGKSVDAAVFNGLQQLGVSIDEVKIETLQTESKGILGIGAKPAKVRLTLKAPEEITVPNFEEESRKAHGERADGRRRSGGNAGYGDRHAEKRRGDRRKGAHDRSGQSDRRFASERTENAENAANVENESKTVKTNLSAEIAQQLPAANPESTQANQIAENKNPAPEKPDSEIFEGNHESEPNDEAETETFKPTVKVDYTEEAALNNPAADFVRGLTARMGVDAKILAFTDEKNIKLRIDSEYMGILIGHRGETLDAIQYLTSLVANKDRKTNGYRRITVNTNNYREKREATLMHLAKKVGEQVKATGHPRTLEPMSSYERRIFHSVLQANPYVTTHSEGEEPNRRVIVTPIKRR